jgi:hypothetical protein
MSAFRFDGIVINAIGESVPGAQVYVCNQPATTNVIPPSPLASLFTDSTGSTPLANPVTVDGNGNYSFYAATGTYTLVYFDPFGRIPTQVFPDQAVFTPGGGTVTSIALNMPAEFSVAGSPITTAGTFAVSKANQNANLVYAGPSSGGAAAPTFRALVTADLPAGVGTVTSIALTLTGSALLTLAVTGSPITTSGTLALTVNFANQSPNTFLAGPATGSSVGAVTARAIVPKDLPGGTAVASAASMTFDASVNNSFRIAMSSNVTSSNITNPSARQIITFIIAENATGGFTFVWPSNVRGASNIQTDANGVNVQDFIYDEVTSMWRAIGPGSWNAS